MTARPDSGTLTDLRAALAADTKDCHLAPTNLRHLVGDTDTAVVPWIASARAATRSVDHQLAIPPGTRTLLRRDITEAPPVLVHRPKAVGQ